MMIRDWIQQHPWWSGLIIFVVVFVLNSIRRMIALEKRISPEQKLEMRLHRAAMALRKLGRAKRLSSRYLTVRTAAPGLPMPRMIHRLWRASSDAGDAVFHLSAVLKKGSEMGASPQMLANLDRWLVEAQNLREGCRSLARSFSHVGQSEATFSQDQQLRAICDAALLLNEIQRRVVEWSNEIATAEANLIKKIPPAIVRSGGFFRNPMKPETAVEDAQTRNMLALRQSREDLQRTQRCASVLQHTFAALQSAGNSNPQDFARHVEAALDEIDTCLGSAKLPLPRSLANAESPYDSPETAPCGLLQRIYQTLVLVEASTYASLASKR